MSESHSEQTSGQHSPREATDRNSHPAAHPKSAQSIVRGSKRIWLFRLLAAALPIVLLVVVEFGLRLGGYGYNPDFLIPLPQHNAYVGNPKFGYSFFPPAVARQPEPFAIPAEKAPGAYRIFVLGSSAAMGDPEPSYGVARVLEVMLRESFPAARFEVYNVAMVAINSHAILPIARACASMNPDLFVVYMGNNEVVGPFGVGSVFAGYSPSLRAIRVSLQMRRLRLVQALQNLFASWSNGSDEFSEWKGMEFFLDRQVAADDPRLSEVYKHFRENLNDVCAAANAGGAHTLLCTLAINLKDCAPFASRHRPDLADNDLARWNELYQAGIALENDGRASEALELYQQAAAIDAAFADLQFRMGRCALSLADYDGARSHLVLARDFDALRFRADSRINAIIREHAASSPPRMQLVDAEQIIADSGVHPSRIPGREVLYEHCHLNFQGNYLIARALFERACDLLPPSIRPADAPPPAAPSAARCAERLALTDWDRHRISATMVSKFELPPFTNQLNTEEQLAAARSAELELRPRTLPEVLPRHGEIYRAALAAVPDDPVLRRNFASLLAAGDNYAEAEGHLRKLLELLPHDIQGRILLGNVLLRQDRLEQAVACLQAVLNDPFCERYARGNTHFSLGVAEERRGNADGAIAHYREALHLSPSHIKARTNLGLVLHRQGRYDEAIEHHRKVIELEPSLAAGHLNLAITLLECGRFQEALTEFHEAVRVEPDNPAPAAALATASLRLGRIEDAILYYGRAAKRDPKSAETLSQLAARLAGEGKLAEADRAAELLRAARPEDEHANLMAAALKYQLGDARAACDILRHAREALPDSNAIANNLAWILATSPASDDRDADEAVRLAEWCAARSKTEDPGLLDTLAAAYARAGRFSEATDIARRAVALARQANQADLAGRIEARVALYENRRPYQEQ